MPFYISEQNYAYMLICTLALKETLLPSSIGIPGISSSVSDGDYILWTILVQMCESDHNEEK